MITDRQREILKAIIRYIDANSISPTNRNLCDLLEIKSTNSIHSHLDKLQQEGYINKKDTIPRSIVLTVKGNEILNG